MSHFDYNKLEKATVSYNELASFSSSHFHPFGAISEFADNSYDADATKFNILIEKSNDNHALQFIDNGSGMSREEALGVISLGHTNKDASKHIGRYGYGLKSGAFHLGDTLLVLTKKDGLITILMISKDFQNSNNFVDSVLVACPSFDIGMTPYTPTEKEKTRFRTEMELIKDWGISGKQTNMKELFCLTSQIEGPSGTIVMISKLKRTALGKIILNFSQEGDIQLQDDGLRDIDTSLRSRLARLYLDPKMEISIQNQKVIPVKVCANWVLRQRYSFNLGKVQGAQKQLESTGKRANKKTDKDNENYFINCGIEIGKRNDNGFHFYVNGRLITWAFKKMPIFKKDESIGISAYVNLPALALSLSKTKEQFGDRIEFQKLVKKFQVTLNEYFDSLQNRWIKTHLRNVWNCNLPKNQNVWSTFWEKYGYLRPYSERCRRIAWTDEVQNIKYKQCGYWIQCTLCNGWIRAPNPFAVDGNYTCQKCQNGCGEAEDDEELFECDHESIAVPNVVIERNNSNKHRRIVIEDHDNIVSDLGEDDFLDNSFEDLFSMTIRNDHQGTSSEFSNNDFPVDDMSPMINTSSSSRSSMHRQSKQSDQYSGFGVSQQSSSSQRKRFAIQTNGNDFPKKKNKSKEPSSRADIMEEQLNELLRLMGHGPIPKTGQEDLDAQAIYDAYMKRINAPTKALKIMEESINTVLDFIATQDGMPFEIPSRDEDAFERLEKVAELLEENNGQSSGEREENKDNVF